MKQPRIVLTGLSILIGVGAMVATVLILRTPAFADATFLGWIIGPYLLLILIARLAVRSTLSAGVIFVGTALTVGFGVYWLYDAFYVHPDPQSGLVVFVLPYFQWAACGLTVAAILVLHFMKWLVLPERGKATAV